MSFHASMSALPQAWSPPPVLGQFAQRTAPPASHYLSGAPRSVLRHDTWVPEIPRHSPRHLMRPSGILTAC